MTNSAISPRTTIAQVGTLETIGGRFGYLWQQLDEPTVLASGWSEDQQELVGLTHPALRPAELGMRNNDKIDTAISSWANGDLDALNAIPVRQRSGPFLEHAWAVLRTIPGTTNYRDLAALAGNPAAARAAASACARNAAALFVPCHRVLRADGSLGGFRYGLNIKRTLIEHERDSAAVAGASAISPVAQGTSPR